MKHRPAAITALAGLALASALSLATPTPASASASTTTITGRASVLPNATESAVRGDSLNSIVSGNGRYIAFTSESQLVPEDHFDINDVYVRDLLTDEVELISSKPDGQATASGAYAGAISADGRYVVFSSISNQLVPNDTNGLSDVFIRDRKLKKTELVSVSSAGVQSTKNSPTNWSDGSDMDVSDDGRYVAFTSGSSVFGNTPDSNSNVLVRDRVNKTTEMVSIGNEEQLPAYFSDDVSMSANGRYVAFRSNANNLVANDGNGSTGDVFVRDRTAGTTVIVSKNYQNVHTFNVSWGPSISDDGNKVAFMSRGALTPGDLNTIDDVFVRNISAGTLTKISSDFGGGEADQNATNPVISGNGLVVAWNSLSGEYISGGGNGKVHVFQKIGTNPITRQSVSATGAMGNGDSGRPTLSKDGKVLAFSSLSSNLVAGDTGFQDAFFRRNPEVGPHATLPAFSGAVVKAFTGSSSEAAVAPYFNRMNAGASPEDQVLELASGAFATKRAPLIRLYVAYFKRLPDTDGLNYWLKKLNAGMKLDDVSAKFAASSEFKTKYGNTTNTQFVTLVYNNIFDRSPDPAGLAYWVKKLDGGMSRGTVMTNFSESSEGKREFRPQVDTALVVLGLLGKIPAKTVTDPMIADMLADSSQLGIRRLISGPNYTA